MYGLWVTPGYTIEPQSLKKRSLIVLLRLRLVLLRLWLVLLRLWLVLLLLLRLRLLHLHGIAWDLLPIDLVAAYQIPIHFHGHHAIIVHLVHVPAHCGVGHLLHEVTDLKRHGTMDYGVGERYSDNTTVL